MALRLIVVIFSYFISATSYAQKKVTIATLAKTEISKFINAALHTPKTSSQEAAFNKINGLLKYKPDLPEKYFISATKPKSNPDDEVGLLVGSSTKGFSASLIFIPGSGADLLPQVTRVLSNYKRTIKKDPVGVNDRYIWKVSDWCFQVHVGTLTYSPCY